MDLRVSAPEFGGEMVMYKEYRRKVHLYIVRMKLAGKEEAIGLELLANLRGRAWALTEHLDVDKVAGTDG